MNEPANISLEPALSLRDRLRAMTPARVGLGRTGVSQQTRDVLGFQVSHARARDAVHARLEAAAVAAAISAIKGATAGGAPCAAPLVGNRSKHIPATAGPGQDAGRKQPRGSAFD